MALYSVVAPDGRIFSAHFLDCKAGLAESCSHISSALFYIECWTRINGKLLQIATNPSFITLDVARMRSHLLACLKNGRMSIFPSF